MISITIGENTKIFDLIESNAKLLLVLDRFEIPLGVGDKSVKDVCNEREININLFLLIVNLFDNSYKNQDVDYKKSLIANSLVGIDQIPDIIKYLRNAHKYYLDDMLSYINYLLNTFIDKTKNSFIPLLKNFFNDYEKDVREHMNFEDDTVFPYIEDLFYKRHSDSLFLISNFKDQHTDIQNSPNDLKNLLLKHFPPTIDSFYRNQILFNLYDLEYDLLEHTRIEEKILIPIVKNLENKLKNEKK